MRSGTFHIFSISGLHVGVIAGAIYGVFSLLRVPRRPTAVLSLLVLWLYVQITGASAPAERAFLMILFFLASRLFRLPGNGLAALVAAALATLLLDPLQLFSAGFQMSYSVVLALVTLGRPLAERWLAAWRPFAALPRPNWTRYHRWTDWCGRKLLGMGAACWAAFLASTPAGIGYFQVFAPGSLAANLIVIPLAALAIVAGFVSLLAGLAGLLPVSALFNAAAAVTLIVMDWLVRHGTAGPGIFFAARFRADGMAPAAIAGMAAVLLAGVAGRWSRRRGGYWPPAVALALILILLVKFGGDPPSSRP
jgi:competence protein ComEC